MGKDEFLLAFIAAYLANAAYANRVYDSDHWDKTPYDETPMRLTGGTCRRARDAAEQAWDVYTAKETWD